MVERFAPESLNDPVALATEWGPCKPGGSSFCTHTLVTHGSEEVAFRPTLGATLFGLVFFLSGQVVWATILNPSAAARSGAGSSAFPILFGLLFSGVGAVMLWSGTRPIVFNRQRGLYWKGWSTPKGPGGRCVALTDIHALQLVTERCTDKNKSFFSYELNLVLKDGRRQNVVDHGNLRRIQGDGAELAGFLRVPFWSP